MISLNKDMPVFPGRPGVSSRRPIHDPSVLTVEEWTFDPGVTFTSHAHAESQIIYIAKGKMRMRQGNEEVIVEEGCYYYTPAGEVHEILEIIEKTTMIIVGTPKKKK
jgi:quercetin dioxygenase-like cupin family protein